MVTGQSSAFELRWGIISTGYIASSFVKDLLIDPKTRDALDVTHKVVAVGSRSVGSAQAFVDRVALGDPAIKVYGNYDEVFADPEVEVVYIGTPHTYHYENALAAIKAKKHVLVEKPATTNAAELRALLAAAKEHNVFFMEAMWTRFQPLVKEVKRIAESGELGRPVVLHADLSGDFGIENIPRTHRILDPTLGGGALLDLGPYPLVWAIVALFEHPDNNNNPPSSITGAMLKTPLTGVDSSTVFTLTFDPSSSSSPSPSAESHESIDQGGLSKLAAQAILSCSITLDAPNPSVTIRFEHGTITIDAPIYCPKSFKVVYADKSAKPGSTTTRISTQGELVRSYEYVGKGWHFQADEVARCVRDGKLQSDLWGHEKSLLEMDVFDEVRRQGGYVLPAGVEKVL